MCRVIHKYHGGNKFQRSRTHSFPHRILVLKAGRVKKFGSAGQLLSSQGTAFPRMPKHAGIVARRRRSFEVLQPLASFKPRAVHRKLNQLVNDIGFFTGALMPFFIHCAHRCSRDIGGHILLNAPSASSDYSSLQLFTCARTVYEG